jgi:hypothetical protein
MTFIVINRKVLQRSKKDTQKKSMTQFSFYGLRDFLHTSTKKEFYNNKKNKALTEEWNENLWKFQASTRARHQFPKKKHQVHEKVKLIKHSHRISWTNPKMMAHTMKWFFSCFAMTQEACEEAEELFCSHFFFHFQLAAMRWIASVLCSTFLSVYVCRELTTTANNNKSREFLSVNHSRTGGVNHTTDENWMKRQREFN